MPWTFYYIFLGVKSTIPVLILFLIGLSIVFTRKMGDGRFFLFFWAIFWFPAFTVLGGKFTRYFTIIEPFVLVTAAAALCGLVGWLSSRLGKLASAVQVAAVGGLLSIPLYTSLETAPHFRLFTNTLGGGMTAAGYYFPHDEFYDAATREAVDHIAPLAMPGARLASETPGLFQYYAEKAGRSDLKFISLSNREEVASLDFGDFIVVANGRRYLSNDEIQIGLEQGGSQPDNVYLNGILAVRIYTVDPKNRGFIIRN